MGVADWDVQGVKGLHAKKGNGKMLSKAQFSIYLGIVGHFYQFSVYQSGQILGTELRGPKASPKDMDELDPAIVDFNLEAGHFFQHLFAEPYNSLEQGTNNLVRFLAVVNSQQV